MKVYTCTAFTGLWPVPVAAVVVADSAEEAAALLNDKLKREHHLCGDANAAHMKEVIWTKHAIVLSDGDY